MVYCAGYRLLVPVLRRIGSDQRCEVHTMVLGTREEKDGWLELVCPSSAACPDDGQLWTAMVSPMTRHSAEGDRRLAQLLSQTPVTSAFQGDSTGA